MDFSYKRNKIGEGIYLSEVYDTKFKTNVVKITFITKSVKENICANALLTTMLITSNSMIKSRTELSKKLTGLYGASISAGYSSVGDYQTCSISSGFMSDNYTINNEKISSEVVGELLNCIFKPDIENGKFNDAYFKVRKQEVCDNIAALINDKRAYAIYDARSVIFENEPSGINSEGDIAFAQKLTNEDLIAAYDRLLKSAVIEIQISGDGSSDETVDMIKAAFSKLKRENVEEVNYISPSPLKDSVREVKKEMDVAQSKMVMGFKTSYEDIYVNKLFCAMLGGSPFSKLFANVREKMSLCYYCGSGYNEKKRTMLIDSGIEKENILKAQNAILQQLELMQNGDFTDEELEDTKRYMTDSYKTVYDSVYELSGWFELQALRGTSYTPETLSEIINNITREQIVECAKSFKLDTVYVMCPKEEV